MTAKQVLLMSLGVLLVVAIGCSEEPEPSDTDASSSSADPVAGAEQTPPEPSPQPSADPAAAFQNLADTIARVMNADGRMLGHLTVVSATIVEDGEPTEPGAAVGEIFFAYHSHQVDPPFACTVKLHMENTDDFWDLIRPKRNMFDFESPLKTNRVNRFNAQVDEHTSRIHSVMDDLYYKRDIARALQAPKP